MSINYLDNFSQQKTGALNQTKVAYATDYNMPNIPYDSNVLFNESDTQTATSTGGILLGGLTLRKLLENWTNSRFSKFFSKPQDIDQKQLLNIGLNMLKDKGLMKAPQKITAQDGSIYIDNIKDLNKVNNIKLVVENNSQNAHFDYVNNEIRVSKNTLLSLPHEIGHAVQEHSTTLLKKLQRFRGNYTALALLLYGLGRSKSKEPNGRESLIGKFQNTLYKYNLLIPLLAFSPELITEFMASKIGIDYLKKSNAPQSLIKAAKKHYAVAFCTYLALPAFAVMDNYIFKKAAEKH